MTAALHPRPPSEVVIDFVRTPRTPGPRLPVGSLSKAQKARELQRVQARRAMDAAYEAELILGLAEDTPDLPSDHPAAKRGSWAPHAELPGVAESFTHELSMVLNCGRGTASYLAGRAWTYRENLPATWAALAAGALDEPRAKALADALEYASPATARSIEAQLLPEATSLSRHMLQKRALELLLEHEPEARETNRNEARKRADVRTYPSPLDGMSTLATDLSTPDAAACYDIVNQLAQMVKADGDPRPIGEIRAAVLSALIRRPWDDSRPAVTAHLTVFASLAALAGTSDKVCVVNGLPITAAHVRELLCRLNALGPDGGLRTPESGSLTLAITDENGALLATVTREQLEKLARRGCPTHPAGDCGCPGLERPPATDAYEPTAAQRAWVKTRDRTCRFPNCGQRVGWADLDHVIPHACGGETDCGNLCCLCRSHHRLKTFAKGWRFVMTDDGVLEVTTPSGITRTTRPPGMRIPTEPPARDEPPPPADPEDAAPPF